MVSTPELGDIHLSNSESGDICMTVRRLQDEVSLLLVTNAS